MGCDFVERELQLCRPTLRTTVSYNYLVKLSLLSEIFEYVLLLLALVVKRSCMYVIRVAAVIYIYFKGLCTGWDVHWRQLANTTDRSVLGVLLLLQPVTALKWIRRSATIDMYFKINIKHRLREYELRVTSENSPYRVLT